MKLVLHVGPNKTGSTVIQNLLKVNQETLHSLGIWYRMTDEYFASHHDLYRAVADHDAERACRIMQEYVDDASSMGCHTLIVSHENLWDQVRALDSVQAMRLAILENNCFSSVKTIIMARPRRAWLKSYCAQLIRNSYLYKLPELVDSNGLFSLLADAIRLFGAYNLEMVPLSESSFSDFLGHVDNTLNWESVKLSLDAKPYANSSPNRGIIGDLILGFSSAVFLSINSSAHPNSQNADQLRDSVLNSLDASLDSISYVNSQFESKLWDLYLDEAEKCLRTEGRHLLDEWGFV